jgi:predicted enzyme involved in methoxymalonyl-ACP biosynthesis
VSVIIASVDAGEAVIDTWLMSCRVLKREMEQAMFDALLDECRARGVRRLTGIYVPSKKNSMVADHYRGFGFSELPESTPERMLWGYQVPLESARLARYIQRTGAQTLEAAAS